LPRGITGINRTGFAYERLADAFRFNRVQGTSLGFGYQLDLPALSYSSLFGTFRFGFADKHPTARVSLVRDAPSGKLTFSLYHDLSEADPWSHGLSAANAVRALLSARDERRAHSRRARRAGAFGRDRSQGVAQRRLRRQRDHGP
jgi:hypothetical protein